MTDAIKINDVNYNLNDIEKLAWKHLIDGSIKKKSGFRTMCVGTINNKNEASLRTVINRKADELKKTIYFYTDNRSRKFTEIQNNNCATLLLYDSKKRIQISVKTHANFCNEQLTIEKWKTVSPQARLGYMTIEPPNTKSEKTTLGYEERFSEIKPTTTESDFYQQNFSVIACQVYELEFLYLDFHGNRKANFYYNNSVLIDSFWAVP